MDVQGHYCSIVDICDVACIEGVALPEVKWVENNRGASMEREANLRSAGSREYDACERDENYRDDENRADGSVYQFYYLSPPSIYRLS